MQPVAAQVSKRPREQLAGPLAHVAAVLPDVRATLRLVIAWTALSVCENLRFPGTEPQYWYFLPAFDVTATLALVVALSDYRRSAPKALLWSLTGLFVFVRSLRIADGIQTRFCSTTFSLYMDLPLIPELIRLYYNTVPRWKFALVCCAVVLGLVVLTRAVYGCLGWAYAALQDRRVAYTYLLLAGMVSLASMFVPSDDLRLGAFARSALPRIAKEADYVINGSRYRAGVVAEVRRVATRLSKRSIDLARLDGANVHLFLIESYGQTALDDRYFKRGIAESYARYSSELQTRGFHIASGILESPTYGGSSWLAHATLGTGVETNDQFRYRVVTESRPPTLAQVFHQAGYRTILVGPATTRPWPEGEFYGFDAKYYAWHFDYRGPRYSWALMPDQFVVDFIRRTESIHSKRRQFVQYALVSSHAPWNEQPPLIDDDTKIGDGSIFHRRQVLRFPTSWSDMRHAGEAYVHSICYDLAVIRRYAARHIHDDSLIIILGDHQPNGDVTGHSAAHGVPVHVVSRNPALIDVFLARGYVPGMTPDVARPHRRMADFFPDMVTDLSSR